jgi:hypothetical protein
VGTAHPRRTSVPARCHRAGLASVWLAATGTAVDAVAAVASPVAAVARGSVRTGETRPRTSAGTGCSVPLWRFLVSAPVRIPADVDLPDRVIGPLTARQVAILAVTGLVLYATWTLTRAVVPVAVFVAVAIPFGACAALLAGVEFAIGAKRMAVLRWPPAGRLGCGGVVFRW